MTITADNDSKTYGQTVGFAGIEFTTSGLANSDTVSGVTLTSAGAAATATVVGSPYAIVASAAVGTGLGNYSITYVDGSLTVNQAALTITADNDSKTYGQTVGFAGIEFTTSGLANSDTVSGVTLTSAGAAATATVVGSPYAIVASAAVGTGLGNYSITYVDGSLTVNQAALTITADNDSKTYGQTVGFAGIEFTTSGLANSDTVSGVTLTSAGAAATASVSGSPYAIVASAATGTGLGNYNITYVDGSLTANQAALTITADNDNKTYGQTVVFAGTEFTTSGLLNSDTVSGVTLTSAGAAATATVVGSPYAIVASAATGTGLGNYNITYVDGSLTANQAALTITADNASRTYGQSNPNFTASYSGFVNGDGPTDLGGSLSFTALATAGSPTGNYSIAPGGLTSSNYAITFVDGTLTVTPAVLTVTANTASRFFGQPDPPFLASFSGLLNGDTPATLQGTLSFSTPATTLSPPGTYPVTPVGLFSESYEIYYSSGSLVIEPAQLPLAAVPRTNDLSPGVDVFVGPSPDTTATTGSTSTTNRPLPTVSGVDSSQKSALATVIASNSMSSPKVEQPTKPSVPLPASGAPADSNLPRPSGRRPVDSALLWKSLDKLADDVGHDKSWSHLVDATVVMTVLASAGYILLNGRGATFLLSLLSARPLWHRFDPLEVLFAWEEEKTRRRKTDACPGDESETLQSLVDGQHEESAIR